jgi:3-deoxy-manno-octulosonate cytidylyltransferase (CMP-KDO synthetase)
MSRAIAIIPARMNSSRFPGKPLEPILGIPLIGHCVHRAKLVSELDAVFIATCDREIADYGRSIGCEVVMTSLSHRRASTRTAEALEKIEKGNLTDRPIDVVVMIQGDEPMIAPDAISRLVGIFGDKKVRVANLLSRIQDEATFFDKNNVKAVISETGRIIYFSREPIPCAWTKEVRQKPLLQTGVIGFRREALHNFNSTPETFLETVESIDMNRLLESDEIIKSVVVESTTLGVDTPQELHKAAELLSQDDLLHTYIK